jgi:hypothetical protein
LCYANKGNRIDAIINRPLFCLDEFNNQIAETEDKLSKHRPRTWILNECRLEEDSGWLVQNCSTNVLHYNKLLIDYWAQNQTSLSSCQFSMHVLVKKWLSFIFWPIYLVFVCKLFHLTQQKQFQCLHAIRGYYKKTVP